MHGTFRNMSFEENGHLPYITLSLCIMVAHGSLAIVPARAADDDLPSTCTDLARAWESRDNLRRRGHQLQLVTWWIFRTKMHVISMLETCK